MTMFVPKSFDSQLTATYFQGTSDYDGEHGRISSTA